MLDFTKEENARRMREALETVRKELGREYPLIIGGERVTTPEKIRSVNPAKPSQWWEFTKKPALPTSNLP